MTTQRKKIHRKRPNAQGKGLFDFILKLALRPLKIMSKLAGGGRRRGSGHNCR
jgi:hypothetical protein